MVTARIAIALLVLATALAGVAVAWRCRSQALAWVQPPRAAGVDDASPPTEGGWLTTTDGTRLRYWFVPGEGEGPRPAAVLVHGLAANRDAMLARGEMLARHGISAISVELRAHGASGGEFTTLGDRETGDVGPALAYLTARADVDPSRLALVGHSLGAVVALRAAAERPEVRAVVAESVFVSVRTIAPVAVRVITGRPPIPSLGAVLWTMDRLTGASPSTVGVEDAVRSLGCPVLFVHGDRDPMAPVAGARALAAQAHDGALFVVEGAAHSDVPEVAADYAERVIGFLRGAL